MIKCMNSDCINYKLALEDNMELCPACSQPTTKVGKTVNNQLAIAAAITGVVGLILYWFGFGFGDLGFGQIFGAILALAGIVVGFISKSKIAILIPFACLAFMVGFIAMWAI